MMTDIEEQALLIRLSHLSDTVEDVRSMLDNYLQKMEMEVLVSCREAARLLGVTTQTITRMLTDGRIEKKTIGESTGIPLGDILNLKK